MTIKQTQNPIIVFAALGVYLGLMLAGATPQVLAQAAMTRQFDVKDEIEVKDDVDKKPGDGGDPIADSVQTYLRDLDHYLIDVRTADDYLRLAFERDPDRFKFADHIGAYVKSPEPVLSVPCYAIGDAKNPIDVGLSGRTTMPILLNPWIGGDSWSWKVGCRPTDTTSKVARFVNIEVARSKDADLIYQFSIKPLYPDQTPVFFENLTNIFDQFESDSLGARQKVLWENTKLTHSNDTVTIVTRLPRGSLDALLAANAQ